MEENLLKIWRTYNTRQFAKIFEEYMKNINAKKYDGRRTKNSDFYLIDGKSEGWDRVQCHYCKGDTGFSQENLFFVLRKRAGSYFIIQRESEIVFEADYTGIQHYDKTLFNEVFKEHKSLFDKLLNKAS